MNTAILRLHRAILLTLLALVGVFFNCVAAAPVARYAIGGTFDDGAVFAGYFDLDWNDETDSGSGPWPLVAWSVTVSAGTDFGAHVYQNTSDDSEIGMWMPATCGGCYGVRFHSVYTLPTGESDARTFRFTSRIDEGYSDQRDWGIGGETSSAALWCPIDSHPVDFRFRCTSGDGSLQRLRELLEPTSSVLVLLGLAGLGLSRKKVYG